MCYNFTIYIYPYDQTNQQPNDLNTKKPNYKKKKKNSKPKTKDMNKQYIKKRYGTANTQKKGSVLQEIFNGHNKKTL